MTTSSLAVHTGQRSRQAGGLTKLYRRPLGLPAPTVTGQARCWVLRNNNTANAAVRPLDHSAPTLYFGGRVNYCAFELAECVTPAESEPGHDIPS